MTAFAAALRVLVICLRHERDRAQALGVDREIAWTLIAGDLRRRGVLGPARRAWA